MYGNFFQPAVQKKSRDKRRHGIRYIYAIKIRNIEDGTIIVYYINRRGSPRTNNFAAAETRLNEQENDPLNLENIKRPITKWVFVSFFNVDVKVVLDRQPTLGTDPLPDWQRNFAHGRAMVALDTFRDN